MIICRLDRVSRHYATDLIFEQLSCQVETGDRIGLVGPNGAGKTTLLKLMAGEDKPDTGQASVHPSASVAFLKQFRDVQPGRTLTQEVRVAMKHLEDWYAEMIAAGQAMADAPTKEERDRAAHLYDERAEQLRHHGGFDFEHRVEEVLLGLRFEPDQFQRDIGTMSGGQQSRAVLARLLLQSPDLMLLDEPTNHLDISAISWLEDYLQRQESALLVVSHDRYFLDKVINKVFELQNGKLTVYPGNYSQYQALRLERQKVSDRQATRQQEEIARLSEFVRRNKAGQLSKQAKSREKMIDRISSESIERVRDLGIPPMTFGEPTRAGDIVVSMRGVSKRFAHTLFSEVDLEIERGQRVGIVGPNGAGKTTLLRMMLGEESATSGVIKLGHNIRLGFLRQEVDDLDPSLSCLDAVRPAWKIGEKEETFRGLLARFGINADVCENRVRSLSGGQRSRVALARIAAHEVNVLVLDEPTNHLDLWAVQALEEAITAFAGTVIVVSHDRAFLNNVCQRLVVIQGEKVRLIPGNYDRYVQILADESAREPIVKEKPKPADSKPKRKRKYPFRKANEIERDIEATDGKIAELEASLNDPAVFTDGRRLENVSAEIAQLKKESARLLEHWEESMELNS